ncbi:type II toxin-antitoxin system HigB family toxin [Propionivibrio sp.]|uniref:type II toxin-antitoxin system HigB family toxin n=1 Tax=Propionivibrio sp. TaxID=2212460 RepID=UPI0039E552C4
MRIVAVSHLRVFWEKNPDAEQPLKSWLDEVKKAAWEQPADIKRQYRSASILKNRRVVFNIKGNDYRLVVSVAYRYQAVLREVRRHARRVRCDRCRNRRDGALTWTFARFTRKPTTRPR